MLDEGHHLGLEALSVHILHGGHLQAHSDVVFSPEQRVRPSISRHKGKNVTLTAARYKSVFKENLPRFRVFPRKEL